MKTNGNAALKMNGSEKVVPIREKKNGNGFMDAIASVTTKTEPVKKNGNGMTVLQPPAEIKGKVDELVDWKKKEKEANAQKVYCEVPIIEWAREQQDVLARKGNFQKSFKVQGVKEVITYVTSDRFSAVKEEDVPALQGILGKQFEMLIEKKVSVSLNANVMSNPALQTELLDLVGKENFSRFFTASVQYLPVEGFDQKVFSIGKKLEEVRGFVKQSKASLK